MWRAYENRVATFATKAEIVSDRVHISKHLNEQQREEHRELIREGNDHLAGIRFHFLFNAREVDAEGQQELMLCRNNSFAWVEHGATWITSGKGTAVQSQHAVSSAQSERRPMCFR